MEELSLEGYVLVAEEGQVSDSPVEELSLEEP